MGATVSALMLFIASLTKSAALSVICLFVASLMTWIPVREEHGIAVAALQFVVVSLFAYLVCGSSPYTYLYILFFGHYAIGKLVIERYLRDKIMMSIVKLLYFNAFAAAGVALCVYAVGIDVLTLVPAIPLFALLIVCEVGFVAFDLLFGLVCGLFDTHLRRILLPRK